MRTYFQHISGILLIMIFMPLTSDAQHNLEEAMQMAAKQVNNMCSMMVDDITQLDSASATGRSEIHYYSTLKGMSKANMDLDTLAKLAEPQLISSVRNNPDIEFFRDNDVTMIYTYFDQDGNFLISVEVTPAKYKSD